LKPKEIGRVNPKLKVKKIPKGNGPFSLLKPNLPKKERMPKELEAFPTRLFVGSKGPLEKR